MAPSPSQTGQALLRFTGDPFLEPFGGRSRVPFAVRVDDGPEIDDLNHTVCGSASASGAHAATLPATADAATE